MSLEDKGEDSGIMDDLERGVDVNTLKGTHIFQEIDEDLNTSLVTLDDTNNHQLTQEQTSIKVWISPSNKARFHEL